MSQQTVVSNQTKVDAGKSIRSFKSSNEVEGFYRFINDNDLRREAAIMLRIVISGMKRMKKKRVPSKNLH